LAELDEQAPDARIINLETSVTTSDEYWKGKGINYRMNPRNLPCLEAAKIDICTLANNHVLDWGYRGLAETITVLRAAGIKTAGAGRDLEEASAPATLDVPGKGSVLVFAFGHGSSGVTSDWSASKDRPGVNVLEDLSEKTVESIGDSVRKAKRSGDIVVASIHWGRNWGFDIPVEQTHFAHDLIDKAAVDLIHGHSSHHAKGIEVYGNRLIIYGCGDLLNDYEGIGGYEEFPCHIGVLYFPAVDPATGHQLDLRLAVMIVVRRFRLIAAGEDDVLWLQDVLNREGKTLGTRVAPEGDGLILEWG
jgi:poly-gamma-glutamate capsule biosynthesis protein CapA/YwtB (metallophosphatase superfamily)